MTKRVIETVLFKLNDGVSGEEFAEAAKAMNSYVQGCEGFFSRRLSCADDGTWIEHIEWADIDGAKSAAAGITKDPRNEPFLKAIDGPSVRLIHSELKVAVE